MNLLYLTQVFETGQDTGSDRHSFFCRHALARGHRVSAITSNVDYKKAAVRHGDGFRLDECLDVDGVDVHYVYSYSGFRGSLLKRVWYYVTYGLAAATVASRMAKPDVVYAVSTPLTVGLLGYIISRLRRAPFVFEVTDVWPDAALAVGIIREGPVAAAARWVERVCYRGATTVVALTAGIRDTIAAKGVPLGKLALITNGVDPALFPNGADMQRAAGLLRESLGMSDRVVAMYLGAHGAYNALETILDAAGHLRHDARILFVLVGDGDAKSRLEARAKAEGLENVRFLPPVKRAESPVYLRAADVFLLPNRNGEFFRMNLPNKLFDYLVSERPIVVAGDGESAEAVGLAAAGRVVPAEDGRAMADAVSALAVLPAEERARMGAHARHWVLAHYGREALAERFLAVVTQAHTSRTGRPA
jgi:glycosyltransferase involved in cell wall biosynthesis